MKVIAIDFDGTLVEHRFPEIGPVVPGAFQWCKRFQKVGARLILWTMRSDGQPRGGKSGIEHTGSDGNVLTAAVDFCRDKGLEFWAINHNPEQDEWTSSPKCYAQIFIDDAAAGCPLVEPAGRRAFVDWEKIGPMVFAHL